MHSYISFTRISIRYIELVKHGSRSPREVVDAPSLETFKVRLV